MSNRQTSKFSVGIIGTLRQAILIVLAVCLLAGALPAFDEPSTDNPTIITNRAAASYEDQYGTGYTTVSPTVMVTVLAVPAVTVTPDETAPSASTAPNERIIRQFRICNTGNAPDFFLPLGGTASAPAVINAVYFDADNSGTVTPADTPVQFGQTLTPRLASGICLPVLYVVETNAIAANSQLALTLSARSMLPVPGTNNFAQDTGTIINSVGSGVVFTSPADSNLPPVKLVENLPRTVGATAQILNYSIAFRNGGAAAAREVRVVDDLPVGIEYVGGTLRLNNRTVTDQPDADEGTANARRIEFLIPEIAPGAVTSIQFQARVLSTVSGGGGIVNFASVSAANAVAVNSSNAVVVVNPVGTVYAGNSGGSAPIAGAIVKIAVDESGTPLSLVQNIGYAPNAENVNPFNTDGSGNFSFALAADQIGSGSSPARYLLTVTAPNYRPRLLEAVISPNGADGFYRAAIRALDNQPIAVAAGFTLTTATVELPNLAALVFNIPMFELSTLEITKSADKQIAEIGDIVSYRLQIRNATASVLRAATVRDTLPPSFAYVSGTAQIETGRTAQSIEPQVNGGELIFEIGDLGAASSVTLTYRVRIGANAPEGEQFNIAVAQGTQPNGAIITTQPAKAGVRVRGGVFSMRQIVIGRVFEDLDGDGQFDAGERPVSGARIYMNNGQSVTTDSAGLYNLPAVGEGSLVISLDPLTVPKNYFLTDDKERRSSKSWTRLLQTPLGGGSLLRQNFAVAPADKGAAISDDQKIIDVNVKTRPQSALNTTDESKTPLQLASLKNKIPLNVPAGNVGNSVSGTRQTDTYNVETTETIAPVAAGELLVLSPKVDEVIMSPALSINVRVAKDWTIEASVNNEKITSANIGETRVDNRNQVTTFSFVGINLRSGENQIRLTAIGADGVRGKSADLKVFGRGAVDKLEIVPEKNQLQAGGREAVAVEIRAFDQRGNPAQDGQIGIETSAGRFVVKRQTADENAVETAEMPRQMAVSLENGKATVYLVGDGAAQLARLKVVAGTREASSEVRFTPELRPQLLVGLAQYSFGQNAPDIAASNSNANHQGRLSFYFRGRFFGDKNLLTLAYDSQRPLNRVAGRDRFGGFDPLDRAYPIFGDSSQRFEDAQSNSKLYARLDRGNSYAMFGDMETDQQNLQLSGYSRRLTGVKLHLENAGGDFVSVTGARPDTAFARDVFAGGSLNLVRLSHADILQGSEVLSIEVRDRRNPEVIISRENLIRSVDYNIDTLSGEVFFLRPISTFDFQLNLIQIVAAYEYRAVGASNYVYTGRAVKNFRNLGLRFGASYVNQQQNEIGAFQLGGISAEKALWNGGKLNFEAALSRGRFASGVNVFDFYNAAETADEAAAPRDGMAASVKLEQPLPFFQSRLRADFTRSTERFFNPFGATVAPGAQRLQINLEMRPTAKRFFNFGFTDERNQTRNVSNSRSTFSFLWSENWNDKLRTSLGFDRRHLSDNLNDKTTDSSLITAGVEYRPVQKLELSVKREQNLSEADPTYPNQTTFAARYAISSNAKLFFTQRLASAPITPIGDFSGSGFASTGSRNETAFGIESKISFLGAVNGRYQIENGANGADSFAVIGLQNRWQLNKQFAVEGGFERGFIVRGAGSSFNSATFGGSWTPADGFRASARYELRDRNGLGQLFSIGAAGKIGDNWTTLARAQFAKSAFNGRGGSSSNATGAAAYRPLDSDKYAFLFSYNYRETSQNGAISDGIQQPALRDRSDTLSADGLYQMNRDTEVYGRFALRFNGNGNQTTAYASALTYLAQVRLQRRLSNYLDVAAEARSLIQPVSNTFRRSAGAELGYWVMPDIRFGLGYNFSQTGAGAFNPTFDGSRQYRRGVYFTITTKLSNLFDLFGTARQDLSAPSSVKTEEK